MNRRLYRKWARWLLPLLVARAFLPVGFMLATTQADGLQLAFCPDQAPIVQGVDHGAMAHAGHAGGGHQQHSAHLDPPCPFAVAAVAAVIDVPHLDTVAIQAAEQFLPERAVPVPLAGPQRADRIRGPPSLS
ncbi:MAG TPA: hypothetical protein VJS12_16725 [Steroidobacteraceae bacterium]|nr:hypothetical protein [Steroidobacteraceae bacterium]